MRKLYADVKIFEEGKDQPLHHIRVDESSVYMDVEEDDDEISVATHLFEFEVMTLEQ